MPNYIDELDTRVSGDLRHAIQVALDNPAIRRLEKGNDYRLPQSRPSRRH
jgi:hypothetical protein